MSSTVLVFSADELRGNIIKKILNRSGFESLFFNRILDAGGAIAQHAPGIVIFDTDSCFLEEINHMRNLCRMLEHTVAIVLGEAAVIDRFEGPFIRKDLCLSDPFDPELIITKVKEIISLQEKKKHAESETLEKDLKHFLNLE